MMRMQFGEYLFPHNPRRIEVSFGQNVVNHLLPGRGARTESIGPRCRMVRCEGEVFGPDGDSAAARLSELSQALSDKLAQTLYLPTGESFPALAGRFAYSASGDGRVIGYVLEFYEQSRGEVATV